METKEKNSLVIRGRGRSVGRPDRARRSARKILRARRNLFHSVKYLNEESKFRLGGGRGKLEYFATARRQSQQRDRGEMCSKGRVEGQVSLPIHASLFCFALWTPLN